MLSIVLICRNVPSSAVQCLASVLQAVVRLRMESAVEYVLVDDASDPGRECGPALAAARNGCPSPVRVLQFTARQHYTKAMAHAWSVARGESILFVSHDMIVTPAYLRTLLAVAALDPGIGIVRGTSPYVDVFPQHVVRPTLPLRSVEDINDFADYICQTQGLLHEEDQLLTGDSMLVCPAALRAVGVFDPRFYGYFGDIDYGLRVQRSGLKLVCAKGAWLLHEGAGYYKNEAIGGDIQAVHNARMMVVGRAYVEFRNKWGPAALPPAYPGADAIDFAALRSGPAPIGGEFQAAVPPDETICRML